MSEQTSQNPAQPVGSPTTTTEQPGAASNEELGGLFQENPNQPAGAEVAAEGQGTGAAAAGAGAEAGAGAGEAEEKPTSGLSREDIVDILREAGVGERETPATAAAEADRPQMTPEQFEAAFNVFKPSEDLVKRLSDESPAIRIKAAMELRDGIIRQAMTMAEYRIKQHLDTLRSSTIEPLQTYVSEQQAEKFHDEFFKKYPDLEPYELIVDAVASKLQEKGFTASSRAEVMKRFADDAKAAVSALLAKGNTATAGAAGGATAAGGNGAQATRTQPVRRMSTLSSGGQGGVSRPGGAATGDKKYSDLPPTVAAGLAALD